MDPAALVVPLVVAASAALLLGVRPSSRAHQAFAALLALHAAFLAAAAALPDAPDARTAGHLAGLMVWHALPTPLLTLVLACAFFARRPHAAAWRVVLAGAGLVTLAGLAAFALAPSLFVAGVSQRGGAFVMSSGPLLYLHAAAYVAASGALLVVAARAAADAALPEVKRLTAAVLGLAFALLPVYSGGYFLSRGLAAPQHFVDIPLFGVRAAATLAGAALALALAPRLLRPLRPGARAAALGLLGVLGVLGAVDGLSSFDVGRLRLPGYEGSVLALRVASATLTLFAVLRYGLADAGRGLRRGLRSGAAVAATLAVAATAASLALLTLGPNAVGAGVALVTGAGAGVLAWRPLRAAAPRAADLLLLPPDDPRAVAERARAYASALAAARRPDGTLDPEGERLLAALRADLDVSPREHELLLRGLESRDAPAGEGMLGRYRLEREIGRGAAGSAWLATDERGARVVVKRLSRADRVLAEARALASVRHPRVVRLLEVDRRGDDAFLVLSYAEGGSARALLDAHGPLPPARAAALAMDVLEGLHALHAAGLVHRDVKLENVLLDAEGRALVADFGSARFVEGDATLTGSGVEGTLATLAPEVVRGRPATPASDAYAVGAVLYRLLTGEHYVDLAGADGFAARERILLDAPRLPHPRVPAALEPVLRRALAKEPAARYASAADMREAIAAALAPLTAP